MSKPNADDHMDVDPHIEKRFELVKLIGKGAYGIVWRAVDRKTRQVVALKKVFDGFSNQTDAQRTYREVMFLQRIHHDNIVRLLGVHKAENHTDLYLVFEFVDTDLYATIRSNLLQEIHKKFVTYQLLRCVRFLHKRGIIHRDLKPANILLNSDCHAKLADFGLARSLVQLEKENKPAQVLTDYVATRWYRPPEIVTGSVYYSKGIDTWAVGLIIAEMLTGKPLLPGSSTMNQMERIVALCGQPTHEDIKSLKSSYADEMFRNMKPVAPKPLRQTLAMYDKQAVDLMSKLLIFNPNKRISAAEAMCHPYVSQFCTPEELVNDDGPVTDPILLPVPDADRLDIGDYRDALYREMTKQKREQREKKLAKARGSAGSRASGGNNAAAEKTSHEEAAPGSGKDAIIGNNNNNNNRGSTSASSKATSVGASAARKQTPKPTNNNKSGTSASSLGALQNVNNKIGGSASSGNNNQENHHPTISSSSNNNTSNNNNNNNNINASVFKGNNLMTTKALKRRQPNSSSESHNNNSTTTNGGTTVFPNRQMASTPAPNANNSHNHSMFNNTTASSNGYTSFVSHQSHNNTTLSSNSVLPPARQPGLGSMYSNNNTHKHNSGGSWNGPSNMSNNSRKPLPSEMLYAGRNTPQPYSTTNTNNSNNLFGFRNNNNNNSNSNNNKHSYASPLVAQFPSRNSGSNSGGGGGGLQMTVKPATVYGSGTTLAPMSNAGGGSQSYLSSNNNNNSSSSAYSKPGALQGGANGGRVQGTRVTSKLRQMVQDSSQYNHTFMK